MRRNLSNALILCLLSSLLSAKTFSDNPTPKPNVSVCFPIGESPDSHPTFLFHFKEFPRNKTVLCLINRPLVNKNLRLSFRINEQGKVISQGNQEKETLAMTAHGFYPGEKVTATFKTQEGELLNTLSFIPYQMICKIPEKDLKLSAELVVADLSFVNYKLHLEGLQEGEKYVLQSKSGEESLCQEISYSERMPLLISPNIEGEFGGHGDLTIITKKGTLSLQLPWGIALFSYATSGSKPYPNQVQNKDQ